MIYSLVFTFSELNAVLEEVTKTYIPHSKADRNIVLKSIRDKIVDAKKTQSNSDFVTTINGDSIERNGRVIPWRKIYGQLEKTLGLGVLSIRLGVPEYICKSMASELLTPNAKMQERLLNLFVIVQKKTMEQVLDEIEKL